MAFIQGPGGSCSATAIAPDVLLTAAHCWNTATTAVFPQYNEMGAVSVILRRVISFTTYPGYDRSSTVVQHNDIGLAFLDSPLPSSVRIYALSSLTQPNSILGSGIQVAGYGIVLGGNDTTYRSSRRTETFYDPYQLFYSTVPQLRSGINRVEQFSGNVFLTDFDSPSGTRGFGSDEAGTTQGDSGSGVFFSVGQSLELACVLDPTRGFCSIPQKPTSDVPTVIGVTSFSQSRNCGKTDYACMNRFGTWDGYTFVGSYLSWIESHAGEIAITSAGVEYSDPSETSLFEFEPADFQPLEPAPIEIVPEPSSYSAGFACLIAIGLCGRVGRSNRHGDSRQWPI